MYSDSDLDDISIHSTEVSDQDADKEYEVEKILATKQVDGENRYLVKWKGYEIHRSTWEPVSSFNDINTVNDWLRKRKKGIEPEFDWRAWDRERQEEEIRTQERRRKRDIKRQRLGLSPHYTYVRAQPGSPGLEGFVVEDDVASSLDGQESSEEEEELGLHEDRKRKKDTVSNESDGATSSDSMIRASRRSLKSTSKKRLKAARIRYESEAESVPPSPKGKATDKQEKALKQLEKRKRADSPSDVLTGATQGLSLEPNRRALKQERLERKRKKLKTEAVRMVATAPKPGPSRSERRRPPGGTASGTIKTFTTLSQINRMMKAGQNEPPPDLSKIELFTPGQPSRGIPPLLPPSRRMSNSLTGLPLDGNVGTTGESINRPQSPTKTPSSIPYSTFRIPKRRPSGLPSGSAQPPTELPGEDNTNYQEAELQRRDSGAWDVSRDNRNRPMSRGSKDGTGDTVSANHFMDVDPQLRPPGQHAFCCRFELGPLALFVGDAKFIGFNPAFAEEMYRKSDCRTLWISKFYGQDYVKDYLAPFYGNPLHWSDIEIDLDKVQPLVNSLNFLKGAGVILHRDFCMLVFLPANNDLSRATFKLPQLQTIPNKLKPALRVVLYPPLDGVEIPLQTSSTRQTTQGKASQSQDLPWWENDLRLALPSYLAKTLDFGWDEILELGKEKKEACFVLCCPPIAKAEGEEFKDALECFGRKVITIEEYNQNSGIYPRYTVLIHQSLRRQLHLLPIGKLRKKTDFMFWYFGTKIEQNEFEARPQKIWCYGTIIFITPQLILSSPRIFRECMEYQVNKSASTKLALPSTWEDKIHNAMCTNPVEELLLLVCDIKQKVEKKAIIIISVDLKPDCTELDLYIDEFALFQLDNPFEYRRYWLVHNELPESKDLFQNIEFYTSETVAREVSRNTAAQARK